MVHGRVAGRPPRLDLPAEKALHELMAAAAAARVLRSAHDPSDGGLAVALAECGLRADGVGLGARIELPAGLPAHDGALQRVALAHDRDHARRGRAARSWPNATACPVARLGTVGGDRLTITRDGAAVLDEPLASLHEAWTSLERSLGAR